MRCDHPRAPAAECWAYWSCSSTSCCFPHSSSHFWACQPKPVHKDMHCYLCSRWFYTQHHMSVEVTLYNTEKATEYVSWPHLSWKMTLTLCLALQFAVGTLSEERNWQITEAKTLKAKKCFMSKSGWWLRFSLLWVAYLQVLRVRPATDVRQVTIQHLHFCSHETSLLFQNNDIEVMLCSSIHSRHTIEANRFWQLTEARIPSIKDCCISKTDCWLGFLSPWVALPCRDQEWYQLQ